MRRSPMAVVVRCQKRRTCQHSTPSVPVMEPNAFPFRRSSGSAALTGETVIFSPKPHPCQMKESSSAVVASAKYVALTHPQKPASSTTASSPAEHDSLYASTTSLRQDSASFNAGTLSTTQNESIRPSTAEHNTNPKNSTNQKQPAEN